jgi:hypothetical protein
MKNTILILLMWLLANLHISFAQSSIWPIVPKLLKFESASNNVTFTNMLGTYTTPYFASNVAFDDAGNIMFYIVDEKIFDHTGVSIGSLTSLPGNGKDIFIIPDPLNCDSRIVLSYRTDMLTSNVNLVCQIQATRITKNGSDWGFQSIFNESLVGLQNPFVAMTVSKPRSGNRSWYVATNRGVREFIINTTSGFITSGQIIDNQNLAPTDMDISPTDNCILLSNVTGLGAATFAISKLNLNALNGNFGTFQSFDIAISPPLAVQFNAFGIEFETDSQVLISAKSHNGLLGGIFRRDILLTPVNISQINTDINLGTSQLEKSLDNKIYAASASKLWGTNSIGNTEFFSSITSNGFVGNTGHFSLPKQLDGENYSTIFKCNCQSNIAITASTYSRSLTESSDWIKFTGTTTILNTTSVKVDANPTIGFVEIVPDNTNKFFLSEPTQTGMFIAQALDGCGQLIPRSTPPTIDPIENKPALELGKVKAYPNPAVNNLNIELNIEESQNLYIRVLDLSGREMLKGATQQYFEKGDHLIELDVSNLLPGFYLYQIDGLFKKVGKFTKI